MQNMMNEIPPHSHSSSFDSSKEDNYPFRVLSSSAILECMRSYVDRTNSILHLPTTTTRSLLNHYGWDKEMLCEALFTGGSSERERLFHDARVVDPEHAEESDSLTDVVVSNSEEDKYMLVDCEICCDQFPSSVGSYLQVMIKKIFAMQCGHSGCIDCWAKYLTSRIEDANFGQSLSCIAPKCLFLLDDDSVMKLVTDPTLQAKYQHQITQNFVQFNRLMKWCPSPGCTKAVKVDYLEKHGRGVKCTCGHSFCFRCGETSHDPISCKLFAQWVEKTIVDNEKYANFQWLSRNTKHCPQCQASIQKNRGCNIMTCRSCATQFCWICLQPTATHNAHNCNQYNQGTDKTKVLLNEQLGETEEQRLRFQFYFNRYDNHRNSQQLDEKLYDSVKVKDKSIFDLAIDTLILCRKTLMYTYAFAFYVDKTEENSQLEIFQGNQEDLQSATEQLAEYLERLILDAGPDENLLENGIKEKVDLELLQNKFKYCESRRKVLIQHVYEGSDNAWWNFQD